MLQKHFNRLRCARRQKLSPMGQQPTSSLARRQVIYNAQGCIKITHVVYQNAKYLLRARETLGKTQRQSRKA
eukprot:scaffold9903_cov30-Tisochrysis_lutea.AAC.8